MMVDGLMLFMLVLFEFGEIRGGCFLFVVLLLLLLLFDCTIDIGLMLTLVLLLFVVCVLEVDSIFGRYMPDKLVFGVLGPFVECVVVVLLLLLLSEWLVGERRWFRCSAEDGMDDAETLLLFILFVKFLPLLIDI